MDKKHINTTNGKNRRSGKDRREGDRRAPEHQTETGTLSTRKGERRRKARRSEDRKKKGEGEA